MHVSILSSNMSASPNFVPLWINGQQRAASDGATFEVRNPQSGKVVFVSASATSDDCKAAVHAAGEAFKTWEHTPMTVKREIFLKTADLSESEKYAQKAMSAVMEETASEKSWAGAVTGAMAGTLREVTYAVPELKGETWPSASPGATVYMQRRAMGVILAIAPWNALVLSVRAIGIPLLCGNTVVLKSSEYSPRSQAIVAEVFHEVGESLRGPY
jgi:acyl-CoA reductase-like NAD-dependent aldehyde dehydrogenase